MQNAQATVSPELEAMLAKLQMADEAEEAGTTVTLTVASPETAQPVLAPEPEADIERDLLSQLDNIIAAETKPAKPAPVAPAPVAPVTEQSELSADDLSAIQLAEVKAEVYSAAPAEEPAPVAVVQTKPARKPRAAAAAGTTPAAPKQPRTERSLAALPDHVFQRFTNEPNADAKADVLANPPKQTKVVEKWENLFVTLNSGAKPSKFTVTGFTLLVQKGGTMTTADLVAAMRLEGLSDGTARAQTGQIMALFPLVGIAHRSGQTVTLRADSVIAQKLKATLGL